MAKSRAAAPPKDYESALTELEAIVADMESGRHGYLLTGQEASLRHYGEARHAVSSHLDRVRTLTSGNAEQESRAAVLDELVKQRMSFRRFLSEYGMEGIR